MSRHDAQSDPPISQRRERLYAEASRNHGAAIARLARAVERNTDGARDLEQEIHLALWRSFDGYAAECTVATWTYRVAHNVAASHAARGARSARLETLDALDTLVAPDNPELAADEAHVLARLHRLIQRLSHDDRSVILLYLEGLSASDIADVTGLSKGNVGVKIHRVKSVLANHFAMGEKP